MSKAEMLTDDQWSVLEPLFQKERTGAGRPQIHSDREVLRACLETHLSIMKRFNSMLAMAI